MIVETEEEAEIALEELGKQSLLHPKRTVIRGLGQKRRILNIIIDLIDMNRGRPVTRDRIFSECSKIKFDRDRVAHFIQVLEEEGKIIEGDRGFQISEGMAV
jgi:hypothetical protein